MLIFNELRTEAAAAGRNCGDSTACCRGWIVVKGRFELECTACSENSESGHCGSWVALVMIEASAAGASSRGDRRS